jgi:hypothetical protein
MPFKPFPPKKFKKKSPPKKDPPSDNDASIDEKGNVRNLIDYNYEEETECSSEEHVGVRPHPRKAKNEAARKIKKVLKNDASTASSPSNSAPPSKKNRPRIIVEDDTEEEEEEEEEAVLPTKKKSNIKIHLKFIPKTNPKMNRKVSKKNKEEEEEEDEYYSDDEEEEDDDEYYSDEDEDDEDDEDEFDEDDDDDEDEEERGGKGKRSGRINLMDLFAGDDPRKPKKYNLKKEPANVRRFVELVQKEDEEEDNIDNDITYFKSLTPEKQMTLMKVLEMKAAPMEVQTPLKFKILERVSMFPDLARIAMSKYNALMNIDPSSTEYYKCSHWINGFTNMPLGIYKDLPVKLEDGPEKCQVFMEHVGKCMNDAIYGHEDAKLQIMQFVSSWIANPKAAGNVLSIHGPAGIGKTTLVKDGIAKALGRPFNFITLGGATDASFLDGHSYTYEGSTWGKIADVLMQSKCMNPVFYFDELDKVSETPKGDEIMNMLIHLTDGSQNDRFQDKYFTGINLDLSRCLFIFSHNNHEKVNPILRDRMYNIAVKGFNTQQKLEIAEKYIINQALREVGLYEKVSISRDILQHVIEQFTGGEEGIRELKRCIQTLVSKINLLRFYNNPKQVPFAIENFSLPFTVKKSHIELFIKKKEKADGPPLGMYC